MAVPVPKALLRCCMKKVSVPLVFCVLILVLIISLDLQVRMVCVHNRGSSLGSPGSGEESSVDTAAVDRVEELLQGGLEDAGDGAASDGDHTPRPGAQNAHVQDKKMSAEVREQPPEQAADQPQEAWNQPHQAADQFQEAGDQSQEAWDQPQQAADQPAQPGKAISKEVAAMAEILRMRKAQVSGGPGSVLGTQTCDALNALNKTRGPCVDTACPHHFDPSPETPVRQLLSARFQVSEEQQALVNSLARGVQPRKYIFVTAASSNHYYESQALVHNLRRFIWPKLAKDSYVFLYYDLGLKPLERKRVEKNCNCTVMPIDLSAFPIHTRDLMCYAWKSFIIRALLPKADVLVYMDASVRFVDLDLEDFFSKARRWGAQFLASNFAIPSHTVQKTFDFYQVPPCLFWPYPELLAGFSVFHNEPFMTRVVLDSWVACAFNKDCMCPVNPRAFRLCSHIVRKVGTCHRFDLSSLTIQMAMLYGDKLPHLVMQGRTRPRILRKDTMSFFTD